MVYLNACSKLLNFTPSNPIPVKKKAKVVSDVYNRLLAAGQRLLAVIRKNEGGANKDLAKFGSQISSLCDKWDR